MLSRGKRLFALQRYSSFITLAVQNPISASFPGFAWKCHFGGSASISNAAEAEPPELHSWLKARNEKIPVGGAVRELPPRYGLPIRKWL
jgi:hypothetical protein